LSVFYFVEGLIFFIGALVVDGFALVCYCFLKFETQNDTILFDYDMKSGDNGWQSCDVWIFGEVFVRQDKCLFGNPHSFY
jgi:hypothetical protein